MPKDDLIYVGHMLDTCHKALSRIEGKTRAVGVYFEDHARPRTQQIARYRVPGNPLL
jgi:hypothetical protein